MSRRLSRWRVPLGFALAVVLIVAADPVPLSLAAGLPIAALGLALRAAAAGHIRKNEALATSGPYRFTRNPLYLGSTILALGLVIAADSWLLAVLAVGMLLGVYIPVIRQEEQYLAARFGAAFQSYAARVPRLFPRRFLPAEGEPGRFSLDLYLRHREYQALIGFVAIALVLAFKCWAPSAPRPTGLW